MAIDIITRWLAGSRNYQVGAELYEQFGSSDFLKSMFSRGVTEFNRQKLVQALIEINESNATPQADQKIFSKRWLSEKEYAATPDQVKDLRRQMSTLYTEMRHLHSRLEDMKEKERGEAAFRILDCENELISIWEKLDHYEQHGKLPDPPPVPAHIDSMTEGKLLKRRNTLRTLITKGYVKHKAELEQIEVKLKSYEK